jgi:hypothetical protein
VKDEKGLTKLKIGNHIKDLGMGGGIILKCLFKQVVVQWFRVAQCGICCLVNAVMKLLVP